MIFAKTDLTITPLSRPPDKTQTDGNGKPQSKGKAGVRTDIRLEAQIDIHKKKRETDTPPTFVLIINHFYSSL